MCQGFWYKKHTFVWWCLTDSALHLCRKAVKEEKHRDVTSHQRRLLYPPAARWAALWSCRGWCHPGTALQLLFQLCCVPVFQTSLPSRSSHSLPWISPPWVLKGLWKQVQLDEKNMFACLIPWFSGSSHPHGWSLFSVRFVACNSNSRKFSVRLHEWSGLVLLTGIGGSVSSSGGIFAFLFMLWCLTQNMHYNSCGTL